MALYRFGETTYSSATVRSTVLLISDHPCSHVVFVRQPDLGPDRALDQQRRLPRRCAVSQGISYVNLGHSR